MFVLWITWEKANRAWNWIYTRCLLNVLGVWSFRLGSCEFLIGHFRVFPIQRSAFNCGYICMHNTCLNIIKICLNDTVSSSPCRNVLLSLNTANKNIRRLLYAYHRSNNISPGVIEILDMCQYSHCWEHAG